RDLLKLRLIRLHANAEFCDGKQRLRVLQFGDGFTESDKINLGQIDQPIVFGPGGELGLFEIAGALEPRDCVIDLLIGEKVFMGGGNQAIGAPSGVSAFSAANRAIDSLAWRSSAAALATSDLESSIFFWQSAISVKVSSRIFCNGPRKKLK